MIISIFTYSNFSFSIKIISDLLAGFLEILQTLSSFNYILMLKLYIVHWQLKLAITTLKLEEFLETCPVNYCCKHFNIEIVIFQKRIDLESTKQLKDFSFSNIHNPSISHSLLQSSVDTNCEFLCNCSISYCSQFFK